MRARASHQAWRILGFFLVSGPANAVAQEAEPRVESIVLTYAAPPTCPSEGSFVAAVRAHTVRWVRVSAGTTNARELRVRMTARSRDAVGALTATTASGDVSERELVAPSCEELASALAIMVAIAIDPEDDPTAATSRRADVVPAPGPVVAPRAEAPRPRPPPTSSRPLVAFELRAEVTSAVISSALPVAAVTIALEPAPKRRPWLAWRPLVALGFRQSLPIEIAQGSGSFEFVWSAANLRACPVVFTTPSERIEVAPCVETSVGTLHAQGSGVAESRDASVLWADVGLSAAARVRVGGRFFVSGTFLATAPLVRRPFELTSGARISLAPPVGILGGAGAGAVF